MLILFGGEGRSTIRVISCGQLVLAYTHRYPYTAGSVFRFFRALSGWQV